MVVKFGLAHAVYDQYSGATTLTIWNLRDKDKGEYRCKAMNSLVEASTSATLLSQARFRDGSLNAELLRHLSLILSRRTKFRSLTSVQNFVVAKGTIDRTSYDGPGALRGMMQSFGDQRIDRELKKERSEECETRVRDS